jgi:AcrR family transcriptional regulator
MDGVSFIRHYVFDQTARQVKRYDGFVTTRRYVQRARAEAAEETRRRILEAMAQRLREAPAEAISVDRVAQLAGVARSTVYVIFGSRAGLFQALAEDLMARAGFDQLLTALKATDAWEALQGALRASVRIYARERDLTRALWSMSTLDPDAVAGVVDVINTDRARGNRHLVRRLAEQGALRPRLGVEEATDVLWVLSSFDTFDQLYTGRGLSVDDVADRLITMAERSLLARAAAPHDRGS